MSKQLDIIRAGDLAQAPGGKPITDPLTGYPVQLWEQRTLLVGERVFIVLYWRNGHWRKGSKQLLDRTLRRFGVGQLSDVPWGPGPEVDLATDDMIEAAGGPAALSGALRVNAPREG